MYEILYIVPAIYTEDELKNTTNKIEALLKEQGAEVLETQNIGKLKFAYPIEKQTIGFYILVTFNIEKDLLKKLNRALQLEKDVLRFMVTKKIVKDKNKEVKEVKIKEFKKEDITEKKKEKKKEPSRAEKEKIKLEDIEEKLDTLLEKEIV